MLLEESAVIGITPDRFWLLTLKEVGILFKASAANLEQSYKLAIWQSWHTEAFHRVKRLPKLQQVLKTKQKSAKHQTVEEQIKMAQAITSARIL